MKNIELNNNLMIENNLEQNKFLETMLGKTINTGLDIGIRSLFPDFIEEQIINIKDNLLNYGIKDGLGKTIEDVIDMGKGAIGIFTGKFDNVNQIEKVLEKGGVLENISNLFDMSMNKLKKENILDNNIVNTIKEGKNIIFNTIQKNLENTMNEQNNIYSKLETNINKWRQYYENKDLNNMDKIFKEIEVEKEKLVPIENLLKKVKEIENINQLLKNKNNDFNITNVELELAKNLV